MSNAPTNMVDPPTPGNAENVGKPDPLTPEKYQGKSETDLIAMLEDAQKQIGHQSNEIGQLRKLNEQSVQVSQQPQEPETPEWAYDPEQAAQKVMQLEQQVQSVLLMNAREKLEKAHPDYQKVSSSTEFESWVLDSPARKNLYLNAQAGDFESANELLNTFKDIQGANQKAEQETKKAVKRDRQLRAATSERGAGTLPSGQTVKAADLRELKQKNPERYRSLNPAELYAKGLVTRD